MDAVIDGLDKPSEHEQLSALHRLRVSVSEHGSLLVDNVQRLFQLLYESLLDAHGVDTSRRIAVECLRLLCEIVPTCGVDLEMRFAALLPALVSALGDERTQHYALTRSVAYSPSHPQIAGPAFMRAGALRHREFRCKSARRLQLPCSLAAAC